MPAKADTYGSDFYVRRRSDTSHAASTILSLVHEEFPFRSVVDVGCGTGTWLMAAGEIGASTLHGFEGPWLLDEYLDDPSLSVDRLDLEQPIESEAKYDLCLCLEVAEHLSEERSRSLVADLCSLAPVVLFGAAIPGQGGDGHVNEQWQSHWAKLFSEFGFVPHDVIRSRVWDDTRIAFWYRQNALVYAKGQDGASPAIVMPLDVVHPEQFEAGVGEVRPLVPYLRSWVGRKLAKSRDRG